MPHTDFSSFWRPHVNSDQDPEVLNSPAMEENRQVSHGLCSPMQGNRSDVESLTRGAVPPQSMTNMESFGAREQYFSSGDLFDRSLEQSPQFNQISQFNNTFSKDHRNELGNESKVDDISSTTELYPNVFKMTADVFMDSRTTKSRDLEVLSNQSQLQYSFDKAQGTTN